MPLSMRKDSWASVSNHHLQTAVRHSIVGAFCEALTEFVKLMSDCLNLSLKELQLQTLFI